MSRSLPKRGTKSEDPEKPFDKAFKPIALELGFFLRDWNDLQEVLMDLFHTVVRFGDEKMTQAIWHSINNDRMQRGMLLRATHAALGLHFPGWLSTPDEAKSRKYIYDEIEWIVRSADNLGQHRDSAVHAPVAPMIEGTWTYVAHTFSGHPRAKDLDGKKLLSELTLYRERARVLYAYAHEWEHWWSGGRNWPLPQRPAWPTRQPELKDKNRQREDKSKAPSRQPRSSRK